MLKNDFLNIRKQIIERDFSNLNNMQKKAVFSTEGPLLVLAGAGSGKTTVLVNRIANLVKYGKAYNSDFMAEDITDDEEALLKAAAQGAEDLFDIDYLIKAHPVNPWQILAITFTNKAAGELKQRLTDKLGTDAQEIWASTFHSACVRILRRGATHLGYTSSFTIYDTDDSKRVIKECLKALGLSDKVIAPKSVIYEISNAKNNMMEPAEYQKEYSGDYLINNIGKVYELYQLKLKSADAMDFDDIIFNTVKLFQNNRDILEYYQNKFKYILVDEYQDTNHLQYVFVSLLAAKYRNICVVGDDDQSIYRFRGATIENILNFENEYSNAQVIRLEQNYRSSQNILEAANSVISHNEKRKGKELWTKNGEGDYITYHKAESDRDEGRFVADRVLRGIKEKKSFSDFAVLYRMNSQSNLIEQSFIQSGIPYRIIGGHKFYDRKEIKDAISYLSVIANPNDSVRLSRIINEPKRGIGEASFSAVTEISDALNIPMLDVMMNAEEYPKLSRASKKLNDFARMIKGYMELSETIKPSELLKEVLNSSGYLASLNSEPEKKQDRIENLDQLQNNIINFENENDEATLTDFLQEISLMTDIDNYNSDLDCVVMMTIHSAKGLEFNTVFLVGMEESIFPSDMSVNEGEAGIEEERRLAYVAITRAKEKLYISNAKIRMLFGMTRYNPQSRFIEEIPDELIKQSEENIRSAARMKNERQSRSQNSFNERKSNSVDKNYGFSGFNKNQKASVLQSYKVGDTVIHNIYGEGVVLSVTPLGNDNMLEIAFTEGKTKKIMANYAKIEKK